MLNGQNVLCIYQDGNIDSFAGAWVVWKNAYNASFIPRVEETLPSHLEGRDVYVLGASVPLAALVEMAPFCRTLTVFGYEETFGADLQALGGRYPANVAVVYDPNRSLVTQVWDHFNMGSQVPPLLTYIADRALWRYQYPETRPVTTALMGYPQSFEFWDNLILNGDIQSLVEEGRVHLKRLTRDVEYALRMSQRRINLGGYDVPVANVTPMLASDACVQLAKGEPFAACYWDTPYGREFDLVSTQSGIDLSELVRVFGGHGTRREAKFKVAKDHPLAAA